MGGALNLFPSLENAEIRTFLNGPESFTPDGNAIISFSKEVTLSLAMATRIYFYILTCSQN